MCTLQSAGSLQSSGVGSKRKAGSMCGPASTCNSSGSRGGLGDDATSKRRLPKASCSPPPQQPRTCITEQAALHMIASVRKEEGVCLQLALHVRSSARHRAPALLPTLCRYDKFLHETTIHPPPPPFLIRVRDTGIVMAGWWPDCG